MVQLIFSKIFHVSTKSCTNQTKISTLIICALTLQILHTNKNPCCSQRMTELKKFKFRLSLPTVISLVIPNPLSKQRNTQGHGRPDLNGGCMILDCYKLPLKMNTCTSVCRRQGPIIYLRVLQINCHVEYNIY